MVIGTLNHRTLMKVILNTILDVFLTAIVFKFTILMNLLIGVVTNDSFRLFLVEGKEIIGFVVAIGVLIKVVIDLRKSIKK